MDDQTQLPMCLNLCNKFRQMNYGKASSGREGVLSILLLPNKSIINLNSSPYPNILHILRFL